MSAPERIARPVAEELFRDEVLAGVRANQACVFCGFKRKTVRLIENHLREHPRCIAERVRTFWRRNDYVAPGQREMFEEGKYLLGRTAREVPIGAVKCTGVHVVWDVVASSAVQGTTNDPLLYGYYIPKWAYFTAAKIDAHLEDGPAEIAIEHILRAANEQAVIRDALYTAHHLGVEFEDFFALAVGALRRNGYATRVFDRATRGRR